VSVDWKVLIISGTYFGEPQPAVSDQNHAATASAADDDDVNCAKDYASEKPEAENNAAPENDTNSKQEESRPQNDEGSSENTNNNADTDSEDDQLSKIAKKHSKSSKYFVTPRPPTSQLVLVIYGDLGKTGLLPLTAENPQDVSFEAGQADEFKVSEHIFHGHVIYVVPLMHWDLCSFI